MSLRAHLRASHSRRVPLQKTWGCHFQRASTPHATLCLFFFFPPRYFLKNPEDASGVQINTEILMPPIPDISVGVRIDYHVKRLISKHGNLWWKCVLPPGMQQELTTLYAEPNPQNRKSKVCSWQEYFQLPLLVFQSSDQQTEDREIFWHSNTSSECRFIELWPKNRWRTCINFIVIWVLFGNIFGGKSDIDQWYQASLSQPYLLCILTEVSYGLLERQWFTRQIWGGSQDN